MNHNLNDLINVIKTIYNKDISQYDESFLLKSVSKRMTITEINDYSNYSNYIAENADETQLFIDSLNITYSEFFRNPLSFALLEQLIIPGLIEEKKNAGENEIRIWSTACAGGQEAYSIAILLDELIGFRGKELNYRIFATDISELEIENAKHGIYDKSSLQQVRLKYLNKYFNPVGDFYKITDYLKDKIDFSIYDLLDTSSSCPSMSIFGDFDLIICGNILFYYRPDIRQRIINKAYYCLSPNGYFVTGEAERDIVSLNDFFYPVIPALTIFRKRKY